MKLFILSFGFLSLLSTFANAETVACSNPLTSRSMFAPATMTLMCGSQTGLVKNNVKLDFVKVLVTSRNGEERVITLKSPPGGIRDYYALQYNDYVLDNIPGLKYGDKIEAAKLAYGISSDTPLYNDSSAVQSIGKAGEGSREPNVVCWYTEEPSILTYKSGCSKKLCIGKAECQLPEGVVEMTVGCPANGRGDCPTATKCGLDESTVLTAPLNTSKLELVPSKVNSDAATQ